MVISFPEHDTLHSSVAYNPLECSTWHLEFQKFEVLRLAFCVYRAAGWICGAHALGDSSSPTMTHVDGVPANI